MSLLFARRNTWESREWVAKIVCYKDDRFGGGEFLKSCLLLGGFSARAVFLEAWADENIEVILFIFLI